MFPSLQRPIQSSRRMTLIIFFALCMVGVTMGNFISTIHRQIQEDQNSGNPVCFVDSRLTSCSPETVPPAAHARLGTICSRVDNNQFFQCQRDGSWRDATEELKRDKWDVHRPLHRRKRGWFRSVVRGVGNVFKGIGNAVRNVACLFFCSSSGGTVVRSVQPNSFPTITCPTVPPQKATSGTSTVVNWEEPTGHDKEDGQLTAHRTGLGPGTEFDEGTHIITYHVTDKHGFRASCQVVFSVKAIHCSELPWPRDGTRHCTNRDISGSTCTFDCYPGYEIQGSSSVTCNEGDWSGALPKCQAKSCGTAPTVSNGALTCLGATVYGTYCFLTCNRGYESQGLIVSMCSESGQWTAPGSCVDHSAPVFTFGCLDDITDYADKKDQPKSVTWSDPDVTDNSGANGVTITYNPVNGSPFSVGQTKVTAVATDPDGNTARCSFSVNINSLHCPEPDLGDDKLMYDCPDGYGYGFSCSLSCHSGYPLEGSSSILCEKDSSVFPPTASWTWPDDALKPFCRTVTCPDLPLPKNGALACSRWTNGPMCTLSCNEKYDVPRNVPETYACGEDTGTWLPSDTVYDCTVVRRANQMKLSSEFYYYSGSCQDEATRLAIAKNFIHILNTSDTFTGVCGATVPECRPQLVDVRCGDTTRRKRNADHVLSKKQTVGIKISFYIKTDFEVKPGEDLTTVRSETESLLYNARDAMDKMLSDGEFNMEDSGLAVQADSHRPGIPEFDCVDGVENYDKGSCRGCPTGTYTDMASDQCLDCPVGTYSDEDFVRSCTACPEGMSTKINGSKSADNCTALCPIGSSSHDGMLPCIPCDPGTYQDAVGATSCTACPAATTSTQGAADAGGCVAFDLKISNDMVWGEVTSDMTSFSLVYWFRHNASAGSTLSALKDLLGNTIVSLSVTDTLQVEVDGNTVDTGTRPTDRWQHVSLTIDGNTEEVAVYLNGNEAYTGVVTSLSSPVVPQGSTLITVPTNGDIHLSSIGVVSRVLSPDEVQSSATSCLMSFQDSGFKFLTSGQKLLVPSQCDARDDCASSPCGSHLCTDEKEGFSCDCQDGWTGTTCDTPPDYCAHHECKHGAVCVNGETNFTCQCQKGFKGELCQVVIVNGQWSEWTKWPECSVTCNEGRKTRRRECDSPPPDDDGDDCVGAAEETVTCNPEPCPVCPPLSLSLGNEKSCAEKEGLIRCNITCRAGTVFADKDIIPPEYVCGLTTGYKWNHQIDNKYARPPSCKRFLTFFDLHGVWKDGNNKGTHQYPEAVGASQYAATHTVRYPDLPCELALQKAPEVKSQIDDAVSDLPCQKDGRCSASGSLSPCNQSPTKKRSVSPVTVSVVVVAKMDTSITTDLEVFAHNGTITSNLEDYVNKVLNADVTVQTLVNDSDIHLQLTLGGVVYHIDPDTMTTEAVISCPNGTIPADGVCGECPVGTREQDDTCVPCEKGTFQDRASSATCQPCPQGKTTLDTGSTQVTDCSIDVGGDYAEKDRESILPIVLASSIAAALMMIAIVVFLICLKMKLYKSWSRPSSNGSARKIHVQSAQSDIPPLYNYKNSSRPSSSGSTKKTKVHPIQTDTPPPYSPPTYTPPPYTDKPGSEPRAVSPQGIVLSKAWQS